MKHPTLEKEIAAVVSLSDALARFGEVCRQIAAGMRGVSRYWNHLHRPVQRLDKKRRNHARP